MNSKRNKKGSIELKLQLVLQVIVVLIFIVLFMNILRGFGYPHRQTAFANVELLRSSINKVCSTQQSTEIEGFELPQNIPPDFGGLLSIVPQTYIQSNGDPTYVLYYENFPAGEAIGWEVYTNPNIRLITPYSSLSDVIRNNYLKDLDGLTIKEAADVLDRYQKVVYTLYNNNNPRGFEIDRSNLGAGFVPKGTDILGNIVFSNIALSDSVPQESLQGGQEAPDSLGIQGDIGSWQNKGLDDSYKFYQFNAYQLLPTVNKTLPKYRSCGAGNLCLKTSEGVYAFPLKSCQEQGVKYIQLVYDDTVDAETILQRTVGWDKFAKGGAGFVASGAIKGVGWKAAGWIGIIITALSGASTAAGETFKSVYIFKTSDFYLASPCGYKQKIKIRLSEDCRGYTPEDPRNYYGCKFGMIKYPIYEVKNGKLEKTGEHYSCLDNTEYLKGKHSNLQINPENKVTEPVKCLKVEFVSDEMKQNFCWTANDFTNEIDDAAEYDQNYNGMFLKDSTTHQVLLKDQVSVSRFLKDYFTVPFKWIWPGYIWNHQ